MRNEIFRCAQESGDVLITNHSQTLQIASERAGICKRELMNIEVAPLKVLREF